MIFHEIARHINGNVIITNEEIDRLCGMAPQADEELDRYSTLLQQCVDIDPIHLEVWNYGERTNH